jgi:hypothetical protein
MIFSLACAYRVERIIGDGVTTPQITYCVTRFVHLGSTAGPIIAQGVGSANSWERKYRYRDARRSCPTCEGEGTIIKGAEKYGGGWVCWAKKGGCGAKFEDKDPAIVGQIVGQIENPDPFDLDNTLLKMAKKRAYTDGTITGTASSDLFTQDFEEGAVEESRRISASDRARLFAVADRTKTSRDALREMMTARTGKTSTSELTVSELLALVEAMEAAPGADGEPTPTAEPAPDPARPAAAAPRATDDPQEAADLPEFLAPREGGKCGRVGCAMVLVPTQDPDGCAWMICPRIKGKIKWDFNAKGVRIARLVDGASRSHSIEAA